MISTDALTALRKAATLATVAPAIRVRIGAGDRTIAEVRRPPFADGDDAVLVPPCAFHRAVSRAHRLALAGQDIGFGGLAPGVDPRIEIGVPATDLALPGGIYRLELQGRWTHILPTTLGQACIVEVLDEREIEPPTWCDTEVRSIAVHRDVDTDVRLLHLSCDLGDERASAAIHDLLEQVLACCSVAELLGDLGLADPIARDR